MSSFTPNRRSVLRTAAWSVPAVTVATAAPSFATSGPGETTYQTVTRSFVFHPTLSGAPLTTVDILVDVEARIPLQVPSGGVADPASTVSTVTIPQLLTTIIAGPLGSPAEVGGTSVSTTALTGAISADSVTNLTIDRIPFNTTSNLVTVARGTGTAPLTIPSGVTGTVVLTLQPPNSTLIGYSAAGAETGRYPSVLAPKAGQDYTLGTFTIV